MKISQEVREFAAQKGIASPDDALAEGMAEKAQEFVATGGDICR